MNIHNKNLSPESLQVLKFGETEYPFTGRYLYHDKSGMYVCANCQSPLFSSDAKYDKGCGWPAFNDIVSSDAVELKSDTSHGMIRTEVICKNCAGHLGHVFDDRSQPTGQWFCINSAALGFEEKD